VSKYGGDVITMESAIDPTSVKQAVTGASVLNHLKNNRLEYLLCIGILHLMGVSDAVLAKVSGVCF
jgi:hypothetical protein